MQSQLDIRHCKKTALQQLKGRWGMPVLVSFVSGALIYAVCLGLYPWGSIFSIARGAELSGMAYVGMFARIMIMIIAVVLLVPVVGFALVKFHLKLFSTTEKLKFTDYTAGFAQFGRAIRTYLWYVFLIIVWEMAVLVPGGIVIAILGVVSYATGNYAFVGLAAAAVYITLFAVVIRSSLAYSQMFFIVADNDKIGVIDSMTRSVQLTKGNKGKLFLLELSFIGWYLLSYITLGIGLLWVIPYYQQTLTNAYKFLDHAFSQNESAEIADSSCAQDGTQE